MRAACLLALGLACAGCPTDPPAPIDAGTDAPDASTPPLDAPEAPVDVGRDAPLPGRDGGPPDGGRADGGPDLGPGSCAVPLDFDTLAGPGTDGVRRLLVDLSARGDHHTTACTPGARGADAVLELTAPGTGRLVVETVGATDAILALSSTCAGAELACNDDVDALSGPARVLLDVEADETVFVVLDTFLPGADDVELRTYLVPVRALGEACDASGADDVCAVGASCVVGAAGDVCAASADVDCSAPVDLDPRFDPATRTVLYRGSTEMAPDALTSSCQTSAAPEIVHRLTMPFRGRVRADLRGRLVGVVAIRTDCAAAASEVACEERGVVVAGTTGIHEAGTELFFVVEGRAGESGNYELELSLDRIANDGEACALHGRAIDLCDPTLVCRLEGSARACRPLVCGDSLVETTATTTETCDVGPDVPSDGCGADCRYDDTCTTPIDLSVVGTATGTDVIEYEGTTIGAGDDSSGACSSRTLPGGLDRVLVYHPARTGTLRLSTVHAATTFDTVIYARSVCAGTELGCNDDAMGGMLRSTLMVPVTFDQPVYVFVDGFRDTTAGTFHLTATLL